MDKMAVFFCFCLEPPRDTSQCFYSFLSFTAFQSLKATRNFSISDWSKNFEVVFQDEEGQFWNFIFIFFIPLSPRHTLSTLPQLLFPREKEVMSQDKKDSIYWLDAVVELVEPDIQAESS